ncbi:hypothetical protein B30_09038 [Celeribacter baekdonensis B30]|uniref:Uncharacterized protein n=1 Tax=Celeribacter baekdonensis B30 TaxID=1208323 RepID=K2JAN0_9RHOB|nr:hypothetical protein B30_09038 [Celeribacter baekdonensis B30]
MWVSVSVWGVLSSQRGWVSVRYTASCTQQFILPDIFGRYFAACQVLWRVHHRVNIINIAAKMGRSQGNHKVAMEKNRLNIEISVSAG